MGRRRRVFWYNPALKKRARELRRHSTHTEVLLWQRLKGGQMLGYDFHRQKPLGNYIVDFFCNELALAIEIDGHSHDDTAERDARRQESIERLGVHFLRFNDEMIHRNIDGVIHTIETWITTHPKTSNSP